MYGPAAAGNHVLMAIVVSLPDHHAEAYIAKANVQIHRMVDVVPLQRLARVQISLRTSSMASHCSGPDLYGTPFLSSRKMGSARRDNGSQKQLW
jgi:hypothetical protein